MHKTIIAYLARAACGVCGKPSDLYAPDDVTPLCARCWWRLYGEHRA